MMTAPKKMPMINMVRMKVVDNRKKCKTCGPRPRLPRIRGKVNDPNGRLKEFDPNCHLCMGSGEYHYGGSFGGEVHYQECSCWVKAFIAAQKRNEEDDTCES